MDRLANVNFIVSLVKNSIFFLLRVQYYAGDVKRTSVLALSLFLFSFLSLLFENLVDLSSNPFVITHFSSKIK